jgi:hypothetical protein
MVAFTHAWDPIRIDPPPAADVARIARTELGGQIKRRRSKELLEGSTRREGICGNDRVIVQTLASDEDDWSTSTSFAAGKRREDRDGAQRKNQQQQSHSLLGHFVSSFLVYGCKYPTIAQSWT